MVCQWRYAHAGCKPGPVTETGPQTRPPDSHVGGCKNSFRLPLAASSTEKVSRLFPSPVLGRTRLPDSHGHRVTAVPVPINCCRGGNLKVGWDDRQDRRWH
jgi:hypothetical protein